MSALLISISVALASITPDGTSMNRFLAPSRQFDPLMNAAPAFITVLVILLGYYHLRRLGAFGGLAIAAVMFLLIRVWGFVVFEYELSGRSVFWQTSTYLAFCAAVTAPLFAAHFSAFKNQGRTKATRLTLPR